MENGEKKKNLSNGTSWFLWGGVAGIFAITSRNIAAMIIFAVIACLLIFIGLGKRKIFDETYLEDHSDQSAKEIDEPHVLLNDVKDDALPEEKIDDNTKPEDQ